MVARWEEDRLLHASPRPIHPHLGHERVRERAATADVVANAGRRAGLAARRADHRLLQGPDPTRRSGRPRCLHLCHERGRERYRRVAPSARFELGEDRWQVADLMGLQLALIPKPAEPVRPYADGTYKVHSAPGRASSFAASSASRMSLTGSSTRATKLSRPRSLGTVSRPSARRRWPDDRPRDRDRWCPLRGRGCAWRKVARRARAAVRPLERTRALQAREHGSRSNRADRCRLAGDRRAVADGRRDRTPRDCARRRRQYPWLPRPGVADMSSSRPSRRISPSA